MKRKLLILTLTVLLCTSCASDEVLARSAQAIADQGYTDIQYIGRGWLAQCSSGDIYPLKYSAKSQAGRDVTLIACSGTFKGVTVRTLN